MNGILNQSTVVKEYEFNNADIDEVDYLLDKIIKDCRKKYFHLFEYRCVYDIKFTNITNNEAVILPTSLGYMEFKSEYYGLNKKIKSARNNGFIFNEIVKLTKKNYSNLSKINIRYYVKFRIPIMHRQFLRKHHKIENM